MHYLEPPYLLDYNYIVVPLPSGFVSAYLYVEGVQKFLTDFIEIPIASMCSGMRDEVNITYVVGKLGIEVSIFFL